MDINAETRIVGLLGYPVRHSLSPLIHNTAFAAHGLNLRYAAFETDPGHLEAAVSGMAALGFVGSNVTIPHKERVAGLVTDLSDEARATGAVNTLVFTEPGNIHGANTDVAGFLGPLEPFANRLSGLPMVVLGSGGAARAVVYALVTRHVPPLVTIVSRNAAASQHLAATMERVSSETTVQSCLPAEATAVVRDSGLVVNATPLGMAPGANATPWEDAEDLGPRHVVYDLVYKPAETVLMQAARGRGATVIGGMNMLIGQAAASYRLWTGREMPVGIVREALARVISNS